MLPGRGWGGRQRIVPEVLVQRSAATSDPAPRIPPTPPPPHPRGVIENCACKMSRPPLLDYINAKMY